MPRISQPVSSLSLASRISGVLPMLPENPSRMAMMPPTVRMPGNVPALLQDSAANGHRRHVGPGASASCSAWAGRRACCLPAGGAIGTAPACLDIGGEAAFSGQQTQARPRHCMALHRPGVGADQRRRTACSIPVALHGHPGFAHASSTPAPRTFAAPPPRRCWRPASVPCLPALMSALARRCRFRRTSSMANCSSPCRPRRSIPTRRPSSIRCPRRTRRSSCRPIGRRRTCPAFR